MYVLTNYSKFVKGNLKYTTNFKEARLYTKAEIDRYEIDNPYWDYVDIKDIDKVNNIMDKMKEVSSEPLINEISELRREIRKNKR